MEIMSSLEYHSEIYDCIKITNLKLVFFHPQIQLHHPQIPESAEINIDV